MTIDEFNKYLQALPCIEDQIVYLRYKYDWEHEWTYSNEILEVDFDADGYYCWFNDWNEGQQDVEILGCIAVSDINVSSFDFDGKCGVQKAQDEPELKLDGSKNRSQVAIQELKELPTIDAIPVEWIENMLKEWQKSRESFETLGAISAMLVRWQKEQEAQDG